MNDKNDQLQAAFDRPVEQIADLEPDRQDVEQVKGGSIQWSGSGGSGDSPMEGLLPAV